MRFYFSYEIELDEGETAESLAESCQALECPCAELLSVNGQCPLGALEVTGLCRLHTVEDWERTLRKERHLSNL